MIRRLADDWGLAVLLVEHDLELVMSVCDQVAVLDFGRKISEGSPEEVRRDPAAVAAYLGEKTSSESPHLQSLRVVNGAEGQPAALTAAAVTAGTARSRRSTTSTSRCFPERWWRCSAPTGLARRRRCWPWPGSWGCRRGRSDQWCPDEAPLHARARAGLMYVAEKSVFVGLSTRDNLRVAGVGVEDVLELFPELRSRLDLRAGLLSGGEQQMLGLGRALIRNPRNLLADEVSMGLGPFVVSRLLEAIRAHATERGTAVLLVEQHLRKALQFADRAYVMRRGRIALTGTAAELANRLDEIQGTFLAAGD